MITFLQKAIEAKVHARVTLTFTNNRVSMLSYRWDRSGALVVRLHRVFLEADEQMAEALASFLAGRRGVHARKIDEFLESKRDSLGKLKKPMPVRLEGKHFDLRDMMNRLNKRYFKQNVTAEISWGRHATKRRSRINFGTYYAEEHQIRIHPVLDEPDVPDFFVEYIVYHEMCHAYLAGTLFGRACHHNEEFHALERRYQHYDKALAWEKENILRFFRRTTRR